MTRADQLETIYNEFGTLARINHRMSGAIARALLTAFLSFDDAEPEDIEFPRIAPRVFPHEWPRIDEEFQEALARAADRLPARDVQDWRVAYEAARRVLTAATTTETAA